MIMSKTMTTTSVDCWPLLLRPLKKSFLNQTLSYMTFCPYSKAVLILLRNGTCYRYGEFRFDSSRRASTQQFSKPSPFPISNVVGMARGLSHILLLSDEGQIWSFGRDYLGLLGHNCGDYGTTFDPKLIVSPHNRFVSICCGRDHSLALTDDGRVFAWGSNYCGQLGVELSRMTRQHGLLFQVSQELSFHRVIAIKCGWEHSLALTEQGVVFGWGKNHRGQLGLTLNKVDNKGFQSSKSRYCHPPTRLDTTIVGPVKCIAAGRDHTLLLTQCGLVFVCGGGGNNPDLCLQQLTKVSGLPLITQIVAHLMTDFSIMIASDQSYYILTTIDSTSMIPIKIPPFYSTIDSVFGMFQSFISSDIPYSTPFEGQKRTQLLDRLSRMFDNQDTNPDIQFLVENKTINVHRCILLTSSSSAYFNRLFSENLCFEQTNSNTIIPITDYTYSIFHAYLRYLYTAIGPKLNSKSILKFLQISVNFHDDNLQYYCLTRVFNALSQKNWSEYFEFSDRYKLSHFQITLANWIIITDCGGPSSIFTSKGFQSLSVTLQDKLKKLIKNVDINLKCQFVVESNSTESKPDDDEDFDSEDTDSGPEIDLNSNSDSSEFDPDSYPPYSPLCGSVLDSDSDSNAYFNFNSESNSDSESSSDSNSDSDLYYYI